MRNGINFLYLWIPMIYIGPSRLPMARESSNKFRLNFLSRICSLTQYLSRQYLPISELRARHCQDSISWAGASTTCRKCSCARSLLSLFTVSTIFSALLAWQLGWIAAGDVLWLSARTQPRPIRNESSSNVQVGLICGGLQIYLDRDKIISILPNVFFPFQFILRQSGGSIDQSNLDP